MSEAEPSLCSLEGRPLHHYTWPEREMSPTRLRCTSSALPLEATPLCHPLSVCCTPPTSTRSLMICTPTPHSRDLAVWQVSTLSKTHKLVIFTRCACLISSGSDTVVFKCICSTFVLVNGACEFSMMQVPGVRTAVSTVT